MQHALGIADDKGILRNDFHIDLDLLGSGSSNSKHFDVKYDMSDATTNIWKRIQKSTLNTEHNNESNANEELELSCEDSLPITRNPGLGTLEPIINEPLLQGHMPDDHILKPLPRNNSCGIVCDHIYALLPLNNLQRLAVEKILDHVIKNKEKMQLDSEEQLLLYIRDKGRVGKS